MSRLTPRGTFEPINIANAILVSNSYIKVEQNDPRKVKSVKRNVHMTNIHFLGY